MLLLRHHSSFNSVQCLLLSAEFCATIIYLHVLASPDCELFLYKMPEARGPLKGFPGFRSCQKRALPFFDKRDFAPTRASVCASAHEHTLARHQPSGQPRPVPLGRGRAKYFSRRTRPTEVPSGDAAAKNESDLIRGLRAANSARLFQSEQKADARRRPPFVLCRGISRDQLCFLRGRATTAAASRAETVSSMTHRVTELASPVLTPG